MTRLYLNPFYQEEQEDQNVQTKKETEKVALSFCLLCQVKIPFEVSRRRQDIQYHYTVCLIEQGRFKEFLPEHNNSDQNQRAYTCPRAGCSRRLMKIKEYCVHIGIAHRKTLTLMGRDPTLQNVSDRLIEMELDQEIENFLK